MKCPMARTVHLLGQDIQIIVSTAVRTLRYPKSEVLRKGVHVDTGGAGMIADVFVFRRLNREHVVLTDSRVLLLERGHNRGGD